MQNNSATELAKLRVRLLAAQSSLESIAKTGKNTAQGYDFAKTADIEAAVREVMHKNGLTWELRDVTLINESTAPTRSGGIMTSVMVKCEYAISCEFGELDFACLGSGSDTGDKAVYKAMTGALKYALLQFFLLPTVNDPEAGEQPRRDTPKPKAKEPEPQTVKRYPPRSSGGRIWNTLNSEQRAELRAKVTELGHEVKEFLVYAGCIHNKQPEAHRIMNTLATFAAETVEERTRILTVANAPIGEPEGAQKDETNPS